MQSSVYGSHPTSTSRSWINQQSPLLHIQTGNILSHSQAFTTARNDSSKQHVVHFNVQHNEANQSSYLLALGYSEQLSSATHSLLQLGALAYDFDADLVEPTLVSTHIFGIKGVYPPFIDTKSPNIALFDVYNSSKVNKVLHSAISPTVNMVPFQDFLNRAPRKINLFHFNTRSWDKTKRLFALSQDEVTSIDAAFKGNPQEQVFDCQSKKMIVMNEYIKRIERQLNSLGGRGEFSVVQALCLNPEHVYQSVSLSHYISSPGTVIFTNWVGCAFRDCSYLMKANLFRTKIDTKVSPNRYAILTEKTFQFRIFNEHMLHRSHVHSLAMDYLRHINFTHTPYVAVHLRMERIIRRAMESKTQDYHARCLANLLSVVNHILYGNASIKSQHFRGSQQVLVMSDAPGWEYGSDSCFGKNCKKDEVRKLYSVINSAFDFQHFQPKSTTMNSAVVSLVEMHMLSIGKKLILVGFGGFQAILENLFLSLGHASSDVYHVKC